MPNVEAMNKDELTKRLARESHRSRAEAADSVDTLVYRLLKDLKRPPVALRKEPVKAPAPPKVKP
jgi:nucleoid DNA-binding protein